MIVLNEHEWAEEMIASRSLGKKPSETLSRVSRYYIDNGIPKNQVRKMMDIFLIQCEPTASVPKWADTIDAALSRALKYEAVSIKSIDITKPEMEKIDSLDGKQVRRLAFTLLCLAKYWDTISRSKEHWVNNKDCDIMRMANINTSIKRQSLMYHNLNAAGMIQFSRKVDNTNVRVCFMEDGEVVLSVTDFRNLGYQYLMYHGEPYFECSNCGITTKIKNTGAGRAGRKQKYCSACANEIAIQQSVNAVMRFKERKKAEASPKTYTVYMHVLPNSKRYIGMTSTSLKERWGRGSGYSHSESLYLDIKRYGWENIKHYKIIETPDENEAREVESFYIQKYQTFVKSKGYNARAGKHAHGYDPKIQQLCNLVEVDGDGMML